MDEMTDEEREDAAAAALLHRARWVVFEELDAAPDAVVAAVFHHLAAAEADRLAAADPAELDPMPAPRVLH